MENSDFLGQCQKEISLVIPFERLSYYFTTLVLVLIMKKSACLERARKKMKIKKKLNPSHFRQLQINPSYIRLQLLHFFDEHIHLLSQIS